MPRGGLPHRLLQHPVVDRDDEAALLGDRDELAGRDLAELGVVPADQRLGAYRPAGLLAEQLDLRLVVHPHAALRERLAHRMVQLHA